MSKTKEAPTQALVPAGTESYLAPVVDVVERNTLPYVQFFSVKTKAVAEIMGDIKGIKEPDPVLFVNGRYSRLSPLKFNIIRTSRIWVQRDRQGQPEAVQTEDMRTKGFNEEIHAVLLVHTPEGLVPVTCLFKSGGCAGMVKPSNELASMTDPDKFGAWMARSPEHKSASSIPYPFARFSVTLTMELAVSKSTGYEYRVSKSTTEPTSAAEANAIAKFLGDSASLSLLQQVEALQIKRLDELTKLAA